MNRTILNDRYRLDDELGKGGMGLVYRGRDLLLDRRVAIKMLNATGLGTVGRTRLLAEARAAAQLNHVNIVSVYDAGEVDDIPFIVMELVEGQSLRTYRPVSLEDSLQIAYQVCAALVHAHAADIIHRDIKPENVLLTHSHTAKLVDFGLARTPEDPHLTEDGVVVGTFAYLAPELLQGESATVQSDLYAFGILLYELVSGHQPFVGNTIATQLYQHLYTSAPPPSTHNPAVPGWLDDLILCLMSKSPEDRPHSAEEVLHTLDQTTGYSRAMRDRVPAFFRNNLPRQLTRLIGRGKEIAEVMELVQQKPLVTLVGSGGVGKTRLALAVAEQMQDAFPDGIWWIELAPLSDPALLAATIASVVGVCEDPDRPVLQNLAFYFRNRQALLILDNCEHLLDACAQLVDALLKATSDLKLLASSREVMSLGGEVAFRVPSLGCPPLHQETSTPESLLQYDAIRLFLDRAKAVLPDFQLSSENMASIVYITQRLDGIPLALELAAARLSSLDVGKIAARLDQVFRLLVGGSRATLERHRTLKAAIEWSYNLLSAQERLLFQRLSVFAGGWTLEAAEAVGTGDGIEVDDVLDLLSQLVNKSLVQVEYQRCGELRYRMLEIIRQYVIEVLIHSGQRITMRNRHLFYYLKLGEIVKPRLRSAEWMQWKQRLVCEWDNFRIALEWAFMEGDDVMNGLHLANLVYWMLPEDNARSGTENLNWIKRGLESLQVTNDSTSPLRACSLAHAGYWNYVLGKNEIAHAMLEESVSLYRGNPLTEPCELGWTLFILAKSSWFLDRAKARDLITEGVSLYHHSSDVTLWQLAEATQMEGWAAYWNRDYTTAHERAHKSKEMYEGMGDYVKAAMSLRASGAAAIFKHDYAMARADLNEAMSFCQQAAREFPDAIQDYIVEIHREIAALDRLMGNYDTARTRFETILAYYHETNDLYNLSWCYRELGRIELSQLKYEEAANYFGNGLALARQLNFEPTTSATLAALAEAFQGQGRLEMAAQLLGALEAAPKTVWGETTHAAYQKSIDVTRTEMGEDAFALAYAKGCVMPFEQAVAYALESLDATVS